MTLGDVNAKVWNVAEPLTVAPASAELASSLPSMLYSAPMILSVPVTVPSRILTPVAKMVRGTKMVD